MGASGLAEISTNGSAGEIQKGLSNAQAKCLKSSDQRMSSRQCKDNNNYLNDKDMKIKFDFSPCFTFHGWKDYNYYHIIPRITLFTAPRFRSNWDETLIGKHFDLTIGWLVFEISIEMECLWKEPATPKFNICDHICCEDIVDAVVKSVNFDEGGDTHWVYECLDLNAPITDCIFYINAEIEHLWDLKKGGQDDTDKGNA